jgi:hypothetical protein
MPQPTTRAYTIQRALMFVDQHFDGPTQERVKAEIPSDSQAVSQLKPIDWVPVERFTAVLRAVSSAKNDPEGSLLDIVECGRFISTEATNTFYRLLLKVISPAIFVSKVQTFWARDFEGVGTWEVHKDESGRAATLKLSNVAGLDHIGPVTQGFVLYVIRAMGNPNATCEMSGWSLDSPGPETLTYRLSWA